MTYPSLISSEPRNKSFDGNTVLSDSENYHYNLSDNEVEEAHRVPKVCFNQNCNNIGDTWINIIGRYAGYTDHEVPYWLCDECISCLGIRLEAMDHLVNVMQNSGVKIEKIGVDIKEHDSASSKMTITTKDLDELIFQSQMEPDDDGIAASVEMKPKQIGCYNMNCSREGTHRVDILNATTRLADHEIPYFICGECYAFFEYRRKAPLIFERGSKREVSGINPFTGAEVITTQDLHDLRTATNRESFRK